MKTFAIAPGRLSALICIGLVLAACGGGGGGGGGGGSSGSGGGGGGPFMVVAGPGGGLIAGINAEVSLTFSEAVELTSVGPLAIQVITVDDPQGLASAAAGKPATLLYDVSGFDVILRPTVDFSTNDVLFGLEKDALYEIAFAPASTGLGLRSLSGDDLTNSSRTFFFRTPDLVFDPHPGYPRARAFLVSDVDSVSLPSTIVDSDGDGDRVDDAISFFTVLDEVLNKSPVLQVPVSPVNDLLFLFNEGLDPDTIVNSTDASSPTARLQFNSVPAPGFEPQPAPGTFSFLVQQADLTVVRFQPQYQAWPPDDFLFVVVDGSVEDVASNSKLSITGSSGPDMNVTLRVHGVEPDPPSPVTELFDDTAQEDSAASSAEWAGSFSGQLGPVLGGGLGGDGAFLIDPLGTASDPGDTSVPFEAVVDFDAHTVRLPVVRKLADGITFEPRVWDFSSLTLPAGWMLGILTDRDGDGTPDPDEFRVQSTDHALDGMGAPLVLLCSGDIDVQGTIDVSGVDATPVALPASPNDPNYASYLGQGGPGAAALSAAGNGGHGGDVLLLKEDGSIAIPLKSPETIPAFDAVVPKLLGVTGRSTILQPSSLRDADTDLGVLESDPTLAALMAAGEIRLQPNIGIGDSSSGNAGTDNKNIDENHPTFVVTDVAVIGGGTTITVTTDQGDLDQASDNIGNVFQPIAGAGDSYLVGRLAGRAGTDVLLLEREGQGAEPYVVVNALGIVTTGGGGGGGGALAAGARGGDSGPLPDPLDNQRSSSGGMSLGESPGAPGGLGTIRGTGRVMSRTDFELVSQTAGTSLTGLPDNALDDMFLVVAYPDDGWMFTIAAFDGMLFTLQPIQVDELDIGLTDGPGADGPGLSVNSVVTFLIVSSLEIGGAGGGGAGVSVTGTTNASPTALSRPAPGAGGGAGGGTVVLETARKIVLGAGAQILARGGQGGVISSLLGEFAGGGGGGGGNIILRAGRELQAFQGSLVSVTGGEGGGSAGSGKGGQGGAGTIRVESLDDSLTLSSLGFLAEPTLTEGDIGRMVAIPRGVGRSRFYDTRLANTGYQKIAVMFEADKDGDGVPEVDLTWVFNKKGSGNVADPPFGVRVNSAPANETGLVDGQAVNEHFYAVSDLVSGRSGVAWDAADSVLLFCVGEGASRVHRLDPSTLQSVSVPLAFPVLPPVGSSSVDLVSLAVSSEEIFLLERVVARIHVLERTTGAYRRTITLPADIEGAMTYDPVGDRLIFAHNRGNELLAFATRDVAAGSPLTDPYDPLAPDAVYPLVRDGQPLESEITGMAFDASALMMWCVDAMSGEIFQLDMTPGSEGTATAGVQAASPFVFASGGVVPSSVAFDGASLFLIHATDQDDSRIGIIDPAAVSLSGDDLELTSFGTLLPEAPLAIVSGDRFIRFSVQIKGEHDGDGVSYRRVRIDDVTFTVVNQSF